MVDKNQWIQQVKQLNKPLEQVNKTLLQKGKQSKVVAELTKEGKIEETIWNKIMTSRIINLENIFVQITLEQEKTIVEIYDADILETTLEFEKLDKKDVLVKLNKKIRWMG